MERTKRVGGVRICQWVGEIHVYYIKLQNKGTERKKKEQCGHNADHGMRNGRDLTLKYMCSGSELFEQGLSMSMSLRWIMDDGSLYGDE